MNYRLPFEPLPITIITGYLGSGKTTLLNRILSANHGMRIAVIVNEFGEIGIDSELIVAAENGLYELSNGCLCCAMQDDLLVIVEDLVARGDSIDHIVMETTGLANPGGILTTLLLYPEIGDACRIDGVITLVDSEHIHLHWNESPEIVQQIAFADRILLNKADRVSTVELDVLERHIRTCNAVATIVRTVDAEIPISELLNIGGYNLERLSLPVITTTAATGDTPTMFDAPGHLHAHEQDVTSVSVRLDAPVDFAAFDTWIGTLLTERGEDLYRLKGIINIADVEKKLVVQGIHTLYNWRYGNEWGEEKRESRLVCIGKNLNRDELEHGLLNCTSSAML